MREVSGTPLDPQRPASFSMLRVPFFLEPDYPHSEDFEETNRVRLHRKWGGEQDFLAQKRRHRLKERGWAVGIPNFDLDRSGCFQPRSLDAHSPLMASSCRCTCTHLMLCPRPFAPQDCLFHLRRAPANPARH